MQWRANRKEHPEFHSQRLSSNPPIRFHVTYIFRPRLAEFVAAKIKKGAHVLIEGSLVSSIYEQPDAKGKKSKTAKITSWTIRADVVRKLDRGEPEPVATASTQAPESTDEPAF